MVAGTSQNLILPDSVNFEKLCSEMYVRLDQGGVCQQNFNLYMKGKTTSTYATTIDCKSKSELYVVLLLCAEPCMADIANKCCFVPTEIAWMFPCCREQKCCPDQLGPHRRNLGRAALAGTLDATRTAPAVSVSVSVEEASSTKTKFKNLMGCLVTKNSSTSRDACNARQSSGSHPSTLGRRMQSASNTECVHGWARCDIGSTFTFPSNARCERLAGKTYNNTLVLARSGQSSVRNQPASQVVVKCADLLAGVTGSFVVSCGKDGNLTANTSACSAQSNDGEWICSSEQSTAKQCTDTPGFSDAYGTCGTYESQKWCKKAGGTGSGWQGSWGGLSPEVAQACCACGKGGL